MQTSNDFERGLILIPLLDEQGLPIFDPVTSSQIFVPIDTPTTTDNVMVVKQASAGLSYALRRGKVRLHYFQYDRLFEGTGTDELTRGVGLTVSWSLARRLTSSLNMSWRENAQTSGIGAGTNGGNGTYYTISPALNYKLGPHTTARLRYEFTDDTGGAARGRNRSYTENALSASLVFHL